MPLPLPPEFAARMAERLGAVGFLAFKAALEQPAPTSLRVNPRKGPTPSQSPFEGTPLPWQPGAWVLHQRPSFTFHPPFHAGAYYVQEANSMLVGAALRTWLAARPQPTDAVLALDLCAAPGGKSTLTATELPPGSVLIANEVIASRADVLRENIIKWGYPNVAVTQNDPEDFAPLAGQFHVVVVDAPCSGEGLWRRQPEALTEWSPDAVAHCAARQGRILAAAARLVAPGGLLLYSTCTWADAEDEAQIINLLSAEVAGGPAAWQPLRLPQAAEWGLEETDAGVPAYRCYPHRTPGEGFFLCALQRAGHSPGWEAPETRLPKPPKNLPPQLPLPPGWVAWMGGETLLASPPELYAFRTECPARLRWRWDAWPVALAKGRDWLPAPEWALCTEATPQLPDVELSAEEAIRYLSGDALAAPSGAPSGWIGIAHGGFRLGWAKHTAGRLNNAWPKGWRIRTSR